MTPDKALIALYTIITSLLLAFVLYAVVFVAIPKEQLNLFTALATGVIGAAFGSVGGFLVGSSLGSRAKDATIANQPTP